MDATAGVTSAAGVERNVVATVMNEVARRDRLRDGQDRAPVDRRLPERAPRSESAGLVSVGSRSGRVIIASMTRSISPISPTSRGAA